MMVSKWRRRAQGPQIFVVLFGDSPERPQSKQRFLLLARHLPQVTAWSSSWPGLPHSAHSPR
ncbi:MAG: hypothetical protein V9G04_11495 [Nocardioides sp.]|jgi:hypothetical protein